MKAASCGKNPMSSSWASFSQWQRYHKLSSIMLYKANQCMHIISNEQANQCPGLNPQCLWRHIYTPSSQVLPCFCYIKTSFHLYVLRENIPSPAVCSSKTSFHLCVPAKQHLTLIKQTNVSTSPSLPFDGISLTYC